MKALTTGRILMASVNHELIRLIPKFFFYKLVRISVLPKENNRGMFIEQYWVGILGRKPVYSVGKNTEWNPYQ